MHETIISNDIIKKAEEQGNVKEITVEVGDLGHIPAFELRECLEKLTNWKINIIEKKAIVKCACGFEGNPKILEKGHDSTVFVCPECGSVPEIVSGKDIILKSAVVD